MLKSSKAFYNLNTYFKCSVNTSSFILSHSVGQNISCHLLMNRCLVHFKKQKCLKDRILPWSSNSFNISTLELSYSFPQESQVQSILNSLFKSLVNCDRENSLKYLKNLRERGEPIRCHYFWPLIIYEHRKCGESGVFEIIDEMVSLHVEIDEVTLVDYICPRVNILDPLVSVRKFQDRNLTINKILSPICTCLLNEDKIDLVKQLCFGSFPQTDIRSEKFIKSLIDHYVRIGDISGTIQLLHRLNDNTLVNVFLTTLSQNKNTLLTVNKVQEIIRELFKLGYKISSETQHDLKFYFSKHNLMTSDLMFFEHTTKIIKILPRLDVDKAMPPLNKMSTSDLECQLSSVKDDEYNKFLSVQKLFKRYCQQKRFEDAIKLKDELESIKENVTPGTWSSCLDMCIYFKQTENAINILNNIQERFSKFVIDNYKIVDLATLLVKEGDYTRAYDGINKYITTPSKTSSIERNCKVLLENIKDDKELLDMFQLICDKKICRSNSNHVLSSVIMHFLNKHNTSLAVHYFEIFCKKLRKTPSKHELICQLLKETRHNDLNRVLKHIKSIHGIESMSVTYLTALCEVKNKEVLKNFISTRLFVNEKFILKFKNQIQRIADENKVDSLQILLEVFTSNSSIIDHIYIYLLKLYCRKDDLENIQRLKESYEKIKTPPDEFLKLYSHIRK